MSDPSVTDWIQALGTVFAAFGTVAAVIVALRQARRSERRQLMVECRLAVTGDQRIVTLRATNDGPRAIKLTMAYLQTDDNRKIVVLPIPGIGDPLPKVILDGESAEVFWPQDQLADARDEHGFSGYYYAFFIDSMGNVYLADFPGTTRRMKWQWRKGWKLLYRRPTWVLPSADRDPLRMQPSLNRVPNDVPTRQI